MAAGDLVVQGTGKKRKRKIDRRLIVDEKVEVRSLEDGLLGSWHGGTVIACNNGVRHVKYDHLLLNDSSDFLVDAVSVSACLDDVNSLIGNLNVRGYIRPIPPTFDYGKWGLPYGLCVDVNYQDAWWEGVIFDHEDGAEERAVFFPDLGDELKVGIETLRITQDWDEATGDWERRGTWSFLELIEQYEQESYIPVSLKQIWYEVRAKDGFMKIGEWISPMNDLWKELVMEVINENLEVTLREMFRVLEISDGLGSELCKANVCINKNPLANLVDFDAIAITGDSVKSNIMIRNDFNKENAFDDPDLVLVEVAKHDGLNAELLDCSPNSTLYLTQEGSQLDDQTKMKTSNELDISCHDEALSMLPKVSPSIASDAPGFSGASGAISHQQLPIIEHKNVNKELKCLGRGNLHKWEPLNATMLHDAALCPDAVTKYLLLIREKPKQALLENLRKHLLYLGWKIEYRNDRPIFRYTSPKGKCFYSLRQVCKFLEEPFGETPPSISKDDLKNSYDPCHVILSSRVLEQREVAKHDGLNAELLDSSPNSTLYLAQEESQLDDQTKMKTLNELDISCHNELFSMLPKTSSSIAFDAAGFSGASGAISHQQLPIIEHKNVNKELKCSGRENLHTWEPLSATILQDASFCPDVVTKYSLLIREKPKQARHESIRKHLLYLGWKIEYRNDKPIFRYTSPEGKCFYSLRQVCKFLDEPSGEIPPSISKDEIKNSHDPCHAILSSGVLEQREMSSSPDNCFQTTLDGSGGVLGKPELLHKAVVDYYNLSQLGDGGIKNMCEMQSKARMHLLSLGWHLLVNNGGKGNRQRWYFTSPLGRSCSSLLTACKICLDEEGIFSSTESAGSPMEDVFTIQEAEGQLVRNKFYTASSNMDVQECSTPRRLYPSKELVESSHDKSLRTKKLRSMDNLFDFSSHLLQSQHKLDGKACESGIQTVCKKYVRQPVKSAGEIKQKLNRGSVSAGINKISDDMECRRSMRVSRSSKRALEVVTTSSSHRNPRTVISWLIDNNMVLPRAKVYYSRGKGRQPMAEGRISRNGIKCCCCQKVFTINGFEIHAGRTSSRSGANILLEDGKSLLECQILCNKKIRNLKKKAFDCVKGGYSKGENDYICSICHFGGTLILCDQCPSSFHQSCLGLKDVPEGDWFCPSCCCGICGENKLDEQTNVLDDHFLTCYQCERKYHVECLGIKGTQNFGSHHKTYWFCNKHCEKIHWGLQQLLGKSIPVGSDNLTWSLLKATNSDTHHFNRPHLETLTENQSKLNVALSVMHECFEPVREHHTRRDIVEDVIFSRRSELKRLNFQGFYTVLLERNDELVSVAAIRVYGEKVAEVPLVGTRFQYRRLGMCRILMNELEERLRELGVQRLVLPAVSSVLNAWTTSFGFSKMTDSERLEFLNYTFLDFQETVMCHKFLLKDTVVPSSLAEKSEFHDDTSNKNSNSSDNICGSSAITELQPTTHTEETSIASKGQVEISAVNNSDNSPVSEVNEENLKKHLQNNTSHIEKFPTCLAEGYKHCEGLQESNDYLKYYRRKSKLVSC